MGDPRVGRDGQIAAGTGSVGVLENLTSGLAYPAPTTIDVLAYTQAQDASMVNCWG